MQISTQQTNESIICNLPDGRQIEITMVSLSGEDADTEPNLADALRILRWYINQATKK